MINLKNDYCYVGHPLILEKINRINNEINLCYGLDKHSERAKELILKLVDSPKSDVHFIIGGTMTNKVLISHALKPYEAVICADSAHINVHETGAISNTLLTMPHKDGKVYVEGINQILKTYQDEHMVKPRMVYISDSTEYGSIYSLEELEAISKVCKENNLYLFLDGARLGCALCAETNNVTFKDLGRLTDVFYIGGAKNGALLGEALVINNPILNDNIRYTIKNMGAMYSKGFIAGVQFEALFEDDLFFKIAKKQNDLARVLFNELKALKVKPYLDCPTNQIFAIFSKEDSEKILNKISCEVFETTSEGDMIIRFVTHYMLEEKDIYLAIEEIKNIIK